MEVVKMKFESHLMAGSEKLGMGSGDKESIEADSREYDFDE